MIVGTCSRLACPTPGCSRRVTRRGALRVLVVRRREGGMEITGEQTACASGRGRGVAALEAALALRALTEGTSHRAAHPEPQFWYRPLAVADHVELGDVRASTSEISRWRCRRSTRSELVSVDAGRHLAYTRRWASVRTRRSSSPSARADARRAGRAHVPRPGRHDRSSQLLRTRSVQLRPPRRLRRSRRRRLGPPAYELALMTAAWIAEREIAGVQLTIVTPESRPLRVFGRTRERRGQRCSRGVRSACISGIRAEARAGGCCSSTTRSSCEIESWRCRGSKGRGSTASRRRSRGSFPSTRTGVLTGLGRLRRRRHHDVPRQAGRHRRSAGRRRRGGDRRTQARHVPRPFSLRPARGSSDGRRAAVPAIRARQQQEAAPCEHRAALVAAREDRRTLPRAVPLAACTEDIARRVR